MHVGIPKRWWGQAEPNLSPTVWPMFISRNDKYEKVTLYWAELCIKTHKNYLGIPACVWEPASLENPIVSNQPLCYYRFSTNHYRYRILNNHEIIDIIDLSLSTSLACKLRQRRFLSLNRSVKWNQTPPDLKDYDPGCLSEVAAPFMPAAPAGEVKSEGKGAPQKRPSTGSPDGAVAKVPKVSAGELEGNSTGFWVLNISHAMSDPLYPKIFSKYLDWGMLWFGVCFI